MPPAKAVKDSAVSIGTFDGFHRGHRYLIEQLSSVARARGLRSIVVALERPVKPVPLLTTVDEKLRLLRECPVDEIIVLPVNPRLLRQTAATFFERFLVRRLRMRHLIVGEQFSLGKGRHGTVQRLRELGKDFGAQVTAVGRLAVRHHIVSSSYIRRLLVEGDLACANELLGREYAIEGMPARGRGVGRTLGFPTINLSVSAGKLLPEGVYAARVSRAKRAQGRREYRAVVNIGRRPTFADGGNVLPEVHLLDFKGRWPKSTTTVRLLRRLRGEKRFADIAALCNQIEHDIRETKRYFDRARSRDTQSKNS